jgi:hypothetical protein
VLSAAPSRRRSTPPAVFNREREARPSRLPQELRAQHQALDLVGAAFDFVRVVGEVDVPDHGAALEHR